MDGNHMIQTDTQHDKHFARWPVYCLELGDWSFEFAESDDGDALEVQGLRCSPELLEHSKKIKDPYALAFNAIVTMLSADGITLEEFIKSHRGKAYRL